VILVDENFPGDQHDRLRSQGLAVRQIGPDVARTGINDDEIIPFLLRHRGVTLFTQDGDFYRRHLCHRRYCVVLLDVPASQAAVYVRRVLRHPAQSTAARRMGAVVRANQSELVLWRLHAGTEEHLSWVRVT
jgi:predicted nuclease of predicted toxin-antitoxin system